MRADHQEMKTLRHLQKKKRLKKQRMVISKKESTMHGTSELYTLLIQLFPAIFNFVHFIKDHLCNMELPTGIKYIKQDICT